MPNTTKTNSPVHGLGRAVRFQCQPGCVRCCDKKGFVYITGDDLLRLAAFLNLAPAAFEARYVCRTRRTLRLRSPKRGHCHFLTPTGCSVHPVKPTQCRAYPFWPELLASRERWLAESASCPGIGTGHLHQISTSLETANQMRTAYPWQYEE